MDALARSEPDTAPPETIRIHNNVVPQRLVVYGLDRLRASAELVHDPKYRERVLDVIRKELAETHLLGPRASGLIREPEKSYVTATSSRTMRKISPTTKYLLNLGASVCYIVEAGIVVSVQALAPVTREEVRALERLPPMPLSVDTRLSPSYESVPESTSERLRMQKLPVRTPDDDYELKIFVVDGGMRGLALIREADGWMDQFVGAPLWKVFYDPHVQVSFMELFAADEVAAVSAPPDLDWDALRGEPLPYAARDWWDRFCKETGGLKRATLVAFPAYARAILETLRGAENEEWRGKPHLLRPGTLIKLRPRQQDDGWLRWEFFVRMRRCER